VRQAGATRIEDGSWENLIITRSKAGDSKAFRQLVERHQQYAYALAFRIVCDDDDAEDVVQESFIRVWKNIGSFDPGMKFTTWFYRIVVNLAYDCMRAESRKNRLFSGSADLGEAQSEDGDRSLEQEISNRDLAMKIKHLAEGLPPKQRLVFVLRDLQDMTMDEISGILDMSMASVKTNLCYARKHLRTHLKRMGN
jgi:RNA polymerase sigma-70 factor (ECF subfamily)